MEICSSVVLHGIEFSGERMLAIYELSLGIFESLELQVVKCGIIGNGFSSKLQNYSRCINKIKRAGFSDIKGLELHYFDKAKKESACDSSFIIVMSKSRSSVFIGCNTNITTLFNEQLQEYIEQIISAGDPCYGYGFYRTYDKAPFFYTTGVIAAPKNLLCDGSDSFEPDRITRWGNYGANAKMWAKTDKNVYEIGDLRDLYPWNYLTEPALNRKIEGTTLLQWIQACPECGELKPVGKDGYIWCLTDDQIAATRPAMIEADILFDPRPIEYLDRVTWAREARERLGYRGE